MGFARVGIRALLYFAVFDKWKNALALAYDSMMTQPRIIDSNISIPRSQVPVTQCKRFFLINYHNWLIQYKDIILPV